MVSVKEMGDQNVIKAVLLDDEPDALETLTKLIESFCTDVEILAAYHSPTEALKEIQQLNFDVLFLDVQMPGLDGFEFIQSLEKLTFHFVFVTAFEKHALSAIKSNALDFLLKPVNTEELKTTIENVRKIKILDPLGAPEGSTNYHRSLLNFFDALKTQPRYQDKITVKSNSRYHLIDTQELVRISAAGIGTLFYLKDGTQVLGDLSLTDCMTILNPESFFRNHFSHIVNKRYIKQFLFKRAGTIILENGDEIPISSRRRSDFLNFIG